MDYRELRKLKMELLQKNNKSDSEIQLLAELQSLSGILIECSIILYHYLQKYVNHVGDHCSNEGYFVVYENEDEQLI